MSNEDHAEDEPSSENSEIAEQPQRCSRKYWLVDTAFEGHLSLNHLGLNMEGYEHLFPVIVTNLAMLPSLDPADLADWVNADRLFDFVGNHPAISHLTEGGPAFRSPPSGMPEDESLHSMSFVEDELPAPSNPGHFRTREVGDETEYRYEEDEAPSPDGRLGVFVHFSAEE